MRTVLKTALFLLGVALFMGGACPSNDTTLSNKVAQSEIYQSYSIKQDGGNYEVTAYFRVGGKTGTTLALTPPSNITFNGQVMREHKNTTSGTYYSASILNGVTEGVFAFTDGNKKTYTNKVNLARVALVPATLRSNGTAPLALTLSNEPPPSTNVNLALNGQTVFVDSAPGELTKAYYDRAKNSIVILPAAWKEAASGSIPVALDVSQTTQVEQGTSLGGEINFQYQSPQLTVSLAKARSKPTASNTKVSAKAKK